MSEGKVRQRCRDFKNERTNVHDEERSGRPSRQTDEIISLVNQKLRSVRRLTISALANESPNLGRTTVYTIVTEKLGYNKLSSGIIFLHDNVRPHTATKTQEKIQDFRWELFIHPSLSPDFAPSDYFLFLHFKK
jgi:hypothetical protein